MSTAYTPGLAVTAYARLRKERRLPIKGEVLVAPGAQVEADSAVARAELPGPMHTIKLSEKLSVEPQEVKALLRRAVGETVEAGELLAETKGVFGLFRNEVKAPIAGTIEHLSEASGYLGLREKPRQLSIEAHIPGQVVEVIEGEGVIIEVAGAYVQGIFGVGGESRGPLHLAVASPEVQVTAAQLDERCRGAVVVGGASITADGLARAAALGAVGMVVGAVSDATLRSFVGYDIGIAITGQESVPFPLILTEGFGELAMAERTFHLLKEREGRPASISGVTQIRAGVIRPEIIIPEQERQPREESKVGSGQELRVGAQVRVIRAPYFGQLAEVVALPPELRQIETEAKVRVVELRLRDGSSAIVPRANVEIIQE